MCRFIAGALVLILSAGFAKPDDKSEAAEEAKAILQANAIMKACESYYLNPNSCNKYPLKLDDLVKPPWGGVSFLNDPKKDLIDPWGIRFQYAVAADGKGNQRPFVWTERTVDKKTKVIGKKPPEKK